MQWQLQMASRWLPAASTSRSIPVCAVEVDHISFRRPVNVADLIRFKSWILRAWPSQLTPGKASWAAAELVVPKLQVGWIWQAVAARPRPPALRAASCICPVLCCGSGTWCLRYMCAVTPVLQGVAHVQVEASVTQPEKLQR